jgi:prepilin-type N-terminal cleavage/methylation domain-containing protein/prepilin-type processing-associated H-X9-DG protein
MSLRPIEIPLFSKSCQHHRRPLHGHWRRSGFSLVELMVVILIVVVLAALSMIMISQFKLRANSAKAVQSLQQIAALCQGYAAENSGTLPLAGQFSKPNNNPPIPDDTCWDEYLLVDFLEADGVRGDLNPIQVPTGYQSMFFHGNDDPTPVTGPNTPTAKRSFAYLVLLSGMKLSKIDHPGKVGMLGERPWQSNNRAGFKSCSELSIGALKKNPDTGKDLNPGGKFNFAFVDGHVETLTVEQSVGRRTVNNPGGLWTLESTD